MKENQNTEWKQFWRDQHASVPFNPDVANVFFRSGMIEAWGRGIERIMEACREAGTPEPAVRYEPAGLWVEFRFLPEHQVGGDATTAEVIGRTPVETPLSGSTTPETQDTTPKTQDTTQETTQETQDTTQEAQDTTQERILALLKAEPTITRRKLAERIGITSDGIKYHLDKLRTSGSIRHVGATKAGRWEVLK